MNIDNRRPTTGLTLWKCIISACNALSDWLRVWF